LNNTFLVSRKSTVITMVQSLVFVPKTSQSGPHALLYMNICCIMMLK